ncbi:heme ABC transporter permease CcmC [Alkalilimnicola ehrlichii MLHE-1]|uniref:Heme exporter protein C n=1 Tax=Alkalilimnicola ehrlichii (strain ATCC BAA-1101 / DSM 17681 / MLHE-1) TaxID=187272 RepID=Q0A806_ALKEH|nr:heme ABC transporter permease CcmC [Alkalilimnicola ehrlichii]ABI57031.1 heme exporter protein CcmC [Alkalilimnicola ehrlichii MLHE-1]
MSRIRWFKFAAPAHFHALTGTLLPWLWAAALAFTATGLYVGFVIAPPDYQQGDSYRIMWLHVPAAWMAMLAYFLMAGYGLIHLVWRIKLARIMASALAPTGLLFAFLALWSGALWGKPTWGAYWVWDARLTSSLILLFLYLGYLALDSAFEDRERSGQAASLLAVVGVINLPIIYFSVQWWNTLHQGASITLSEAPTMSASMLAALLLTTVGCWAYTAAAALHRARSMVLEQAGNSHWVRRLRQGHRPAAARGRPARLAATPIGDLLGRRP